MGNSKLLEDPLDEIFTDYIAVIENTLLPQHKLLNEQSNLVFTYTAMHGVGFRYIKKVFETIGVEMVSVIEQQEPDPEFPTVK